MLNLLAVSFAASAQAVFKGGQAALDRFLQAHIVYPEYSRKNCIEATIQVSFRIKPDGSVDKVKVHRGEGIDLDDEAVRVVKMTSGQWAIPDRRVKEANMILPIHFTPDYSRCATLVGLDRRQAIVAYQNRQELENAVTNYYKNKYAGKADTTKENYIQALKQQLGFDDELIDDVLDQAQEKLKQGDREGACTDWKFIHNIGSNRADSFLAKYCR